MGAVFISYRRGDSEGQARALSNDLAEHIGKNSVFMDVDSIALGLDFREVLHERLQSCDIMLALIGPNWIDAKDAGGNRRLESPTDFVRQEVAAALKRNIPVTPVLVQGAQMPSPDRLPEDLKELAFRNGFELSHTRWESDVTELVKRLGLSTIETHPGSSPNVPESPASTAGTGSVMAGVGAQPHPPGTSGDNFASRQGSVPSKSSNKFIGPIVGAVAAIVVMVVLLAWYGLSDGSTPSTDQTEVAAGSGKSAEMEPAVGAPSAASSTVSFDPIVQGVRQIVLGDKAIAGPVAATTDGWVAIASAGETVPSPKAFVMARVYEAGRVAAFGHNGFLASAQRDNPVFIANLVRWLSADAQNHEQVCFTSSHGELNINEPATSATLATAGFKVRTIPQSIAPFTISGCGVVIINNAGKPFSRDEIQTLEEGVAEGQGLLLGGLGWAYAQYSETKNIEDYPMLQVGRVFGVEWPTSYLADPDPQNESNGLTIFRSFYPDAKP